MGIQFSRRTWEQMFKRIDRDMDQQVTLDDLFMFIFPDNSISQREENERIKTLQGRIRKFSTLYQSTSSFRVEKPANVQRSQSNNNTISTIIYNGLTR